MKKERSKRLSRIKPSRSKQPHLWLLKHEVEDEQYRRVLADLCKLIKASERSTKAARKADVQEFAEFVAQNESRYTEDLLGISFLVLQAKVGKISATAAKLASTSRGAKFESLRSAQDVMAIGDVFRDKGATLIQLISAMGDYYKHREDWSPAVWEERKPGERETRSLVRSRQVRMQVQTLGVMRGSTSNLRVAYECLGVPTYSKCGKLAIRVRAWGKKVYGQAKKSLEASKRRK